MVQHAACKYCKTNVKKVREWLEIVDIEPFINLFNSMWSIHKSPDKSSHFLTETTHLRTQSQKNSKKSHLARNMLK